MTTITYEIYYLKLRANLEAGIAPSRVDEVLAAYQRNLFDDTTLRK
jgi:hypothetical protein